MKLDKITQTGKWHEVYAPDLDAATQEQFEKAMKEPFAVAGALMPDAHLGYSVPIGSVIVTSGVVVPEWWNYSKPFTMPEKLKKIKSLFPKESWSDLEDFN